MTEALALNANWLDTETALQNSAQTVGNVQLTVTTAYPYSYWNQYDLVPHYCYPITQYVTSPARPIKLTLSDVDKLRKAAKADKALKEILAKFTSMIEIMVDFD